MYYVVKPKQKMILSRKLLWIPIREIQENADFIELLLPVKGESQMQALVSKWFSGANSCASMLSAKTIHSNYKINVLETSFFLEEGLRQHIYPKALLRKPQNTAERDLFQKYVAEGIDKIDEKIKGADPQEAQKARNLFADIKKPVPEPKPPKANPQMDISISITPKEKVKGKVAESTTPEIVRTQMSAVEGAGLVIRNRPVQNDFLSQTENSVAHLLDVLEHLPEIEKQKVQELSRIDCKQQDLLHIIELVDLNAADRAKVFSALQEVRRERRAIKNALDVCSSLRQLRKATDLSVLKSAMHGIAAISERIYSTKVLTEEDMHRFVPNQTAYSKIFSK